MKQFNESFYTDDFDHEMLNWLIDKGCKVKGTYICSNPDVSDKNLVYGTGSDYYWTDSEPFHSYKRLTKNQFKEKIGMTKEDQPENNTFTKSMLESGEHIIETREGERFIVAGDYLLGESDYNHTENLTDTLEDVNKEQEFDIVKVYSGKVYKGINILAGKGILDYINSDSLTLIWERESPEQKEKRLQKEKLELKLQQLQKECKIVEDEIMKLGKE